MALWISDRFPHVNPLYVLYCLWDQLWKTGIDIPYVWGSLQNNLVGGMFGAFFVVLVSSYVRMVRPPEALKGRSGAAVLSGGTLIISLGAVAWLLLKR